MPEDVKPPEIPVVPPASTQIDVPIDPPKPDTPPAPDKPKTYDPIATAHVLARQDPVAIEATLAKMVTLDPEKFAWMTDQPDAPPAPPPATPKPDAQPADASAARLDALERKSLVSEAMLEYGLKPEHRQFITGTTPNAIKRSAYNLNELLGSNGQPAKPAGTDVPPPPPGENPPAPTGETTDDAIPVYSGTQGTPSVEECARALDEILPTKGWDKIGLG